MKNIYPSILLSFFCLFTASEVFSQTVDFEGETFAEGADFGSATYVSGNIRLIYSASNWFEDTDDGESNSNAISAISGSGSLETIIVETVDDSELDFQSFYYLNFTTIAQIEGFRDNDVTPVGTQSTGFGAGASTGATVTLDNAIFDNVDRMVITSPGTGFFDAFDSFSFGPAVVANNPPTAASFTAASGPFENLTYTFSTGDFGYSDGDGDPIDHVLIEALPANGTLYLDADNGDDFDGGEAVTILQQISKADLDAGNLQYIQNGITSTTFQFEVSDGIDTSTGDYIATLNIVPVPTVTLSLASASKDESNVTTTGVTATLSNAYGATVSVSLGFTGTAAGSGTDYTASGTSIDITAGSTTGNITLTNVNESIVEADETVIIDILSVTNGTEDGGLQQETFTINNEDVATVTIADITPNENDGTATITLTLDAAVDGGFDVDVSTADNTATTADGDYAAITNATETFAGTASETETLTITLGGDTKVETDEIVDLAMSNLVPTTVDAADIDITDNATVTLLNDDQATVTIANVSANEDAGSVLVTLTLDNAVQDGFDVDVNTSDGTATTADSDYTPIVGQTLTFAGTALETETFSITFIPDVIFEADETLSVVMSTVAPPTVSFSDIVITDNATITILDDDAIVPDFTATWLDNSGNGDIDQLRLDFTEAVDFTDANGGTGIFDAITVTGGIALTNGGSVDYSSITNVTTYTFGVTGVTGTGDPGETITYAAGTQNTIVANSGGLELSASPTSILDGAVPVLLAASSTPLDGATDVAINTDVVLLFSENVQGGSGNIELIDVTNGTGTRTIPIGNAQLTFSTNTLTINPSSDLENLVNYAVNVDANAIDDLATPENSFSGINDNTTQDFTTIGSTPTFAATWLDNSGDGDIDQLRLDFSEAVDFTDGNAGTGIFDAITVSGGIALTNAGSIDYSSITNVTTYTFDVTGVTGTADPSETISYAAGAQNTIVANVGGQPLTASPTSILDGAAPIVLTNITQDSDGNGFIDQILISFSEIIDAGTVDEVANPTVTDDFTIAGYAIASVLPAAGSGNDDDELIIALVENSTADTDATPTITLGAGTIEDLAVAANGNVVFSAAAVDNAGPAIISAVTDDSDGNGEIDEILVTFSEVIDATTLDETANPTVTDDFSVTGFAITAVTPLAGTGVDDDEVIISIAESGSSDTDTTPQVDLTVGTIGDGIAPTLNPVFGANATDGASPTIVSYSLATGNNFIDLTFSEGVYASDGSTELAFTDFIIQNFSDGGDGGATGVSITGVTDINGDPITGLGGGQTTLRLDLSVAPDVFAAEVNDVFDVTPASGSAVFDNASTPNAMLATATTNPDVALNLVDIGNKPVFLSVLPNSDNTLIRLEFSTDVDKDGDANGRLVYRPNGGREIDDNNYTDPDGNTTFSVPTPDGGSNVQNLNGIGGDGNKYAPIWTMDINVGGATARGNETVEIIVPGNDEIFKSLNDPDGRGTPMDATTVTINLADENAETFDNTDVTATAYDRDQNGNIDSVHIVMTDNIPDASIAASIANNDFTFGSVNPASFNNEGTPDDNEFALIFDDYSGTESSVLAFTTGNMTDDAGASSYDGSNNNIQSGSLTPLDAAAAIIVAAETRDTEATPDGFIDQIAVTFSEDIDGTSINAGGADFTLSDTYVITSAAWDGTNTVLLNLTEKGVRDTDARPNVTLLANTIEDQSSNNNSLGSDFAFNNTADKVAPYLEVASLTTSDQSPDLSGLVDDPGATVLLNIGSFTRTAVNDGAGNWNFTNTGGTNPFTLTDPTTYEVTAIGIDAFGNSQVDATTNELTIVGGVVLSHNGNTVGDITTDTEFCGNDQFEPLGDVVLTETNTSDFAIQTDASLLISAPDGFRFNDAITPTITGDNLGDLSAVTFSYLSERVIELSFSVTGIVTFDVLTISNLEIAGATTGISQITRTGGDLVSLGINSVGTAFAQVNVAAAPDALTNLTVDYTTPNVLSESNILETAMLQEAEFSVTPNGVTESTVTWYDADGTSVLASSATGVVSQADILSASNNTAGLFTRFVAQSDGSCEGPLLKANFLVYSFDDGGLNTEFDGALYSLAASADPFDLTFSVPANHTVDVTSDGPITSVTTAGTSITATLDPGGLNGNYQVNYVITNALGESRTLTADVEVATTSPLYEPNQFFENGISSATDNEYCLNDDLEFEVNNTLVATANANDSYFYGIGWVPQNETFKRGAVRFYGMVPPVGANTEVGTTLNGNNPLAGWSIDLEEINRLARSGSGEPQAYAEAALKFGVRMTAVIIKYSRQILIPNAPIPPTITQSNFNIVQQHSFTITPLPTVDISGNTTSYCIDDNTDYTLQARVNGTTLDMDNGYEVWNADYSTRLTDEADAIFNPTEYAANTYNIVYEADLVDGCTTSDSLQIVVNPIPAEAALRTTSIATMLPFRIDNNPADRFNGLDSYVVEVPNLDSLFSNTYLQKFMIADNSAGQYNWYNSVNTSGVVTGDPEQLLKSSFFLRFNEAFDYPHTSGTVENPTVGEHVFYFARVENGCESALRKITMYIYDEVPIPVIDPTFISGLDLSEASVFQVETDYFIAEFCDDYAPNAIVFDGPDASGSNPTSRNPDAYFNLYSSVAGGSSPANLVAVLDDLGGAATLTAGDFGYSGTGAFDTTIYIKEVWNDLTPGFNNTGTLAGNDLFEGTESDFLRIDITIFETPSTPALATDFSGLSSLDLHVCEGENFTQFLNTAAGIDEYVWYSADGSSELLRVESGGNLTSANLAATAGYDQDVPGIYTFQVSRIQYANEDTGFLGCESAQTQVTIEVHELQGPPTISSADFADQNPGADEYRYVVCLSEIDGANVVEASSPFANPKYFNWYASDAAANVGTLRFQSIDTDGNPNPTFNDLGLNASTITSATSRFFVVLQQTDVDDFDGCEDRISGKALVEVQFVNDAALTFEPVLSNADTTNVNEIASLNQICVDDADVAINLLADGSSITGADLANLSYEIKSPTVSAISSTGTGNPVLDLETIHTNAGGSVVGGDSTVHFLTMDYVNSNGCVNSVSTAFTIYPKPELTFTINNADADNVRFCHDDADVSLEGFFSDLSALDLSGATTATFSGDGISAGSKGEAIFSPSAAHGGPFDLPSSHVIVLDYTTAVGCTNSVSKTIFVDPRPEFIAVSNGSAEDGDRIRFSELCADGGATSVSVQLVDPTDAGGTLEVVDYTGYTFDWSVGSVNQSVSGDNTFSFTSVSDELIIDLTVTDPNGCTVEIQETHEKQSLPELEIALDGADAFTYCSEDADPIVTLIDNNVELGSPGATVAASDVISWSISSSNNTDGTTATVSGTAGTLPTIGLQSLHESAGGNTYTDVNGILRSVGGAITFHDIEITYEDQELTYQGLQTNCQNTITERLTINPSPDITFTINDIDTDNVRFCHDDADVSLEGFFSDLSALDLSGATTATFSGDGVFAGSKGEARFSPSTAHGGAFDVPSSHVIVFEYTSAVGCVNSISKTIFVDPRPEFIAVSNGSSEDGNRIRFSELCADGGATSVSVQLVDPTDAGGTLEVADYTGYTFEWSVGSVNQSVSGINTFSFTSTSDDFTIELIVTDPNGCTVDIEETHEKQSLPELEIALDGLSTEAAFSYCSEDADPLVTLIDNNAELGSPGAPVAASNVISWSISSSNNTNGTTATVSGTAGTLPTIGLQSLHESAGGNTYTDVNGILRSIGGAVTFHDIEITYEDQELTYQGLQTNCQSTITEQLTINPSPNIDFTIGDGSTDTFCYDEGSITLRGVSVEAGVILNQNGVFKVIVGQDDDFSTEIDDITLSTTDRAAVFDTRIRQDFRFDGGNNPQFESQQEYVVQYEYADENGCPHFVEKSIFVNPLPEPVAEDGFFIQVNSICASEEISLFVEQVFQSGESAADFTYAWSLNGELSDVIIGDNNFVFDIDDNVTAINVAVVITNNNTGCATSITAENKEVGQDPLPSLSWVGTTLGSPLGTDFNIYQDNPTVTPDGIENITVVIDEDDANPIQIAIGTGFPVTFQYNFTTAGEHLVDVIMSTSDGCDETIRRKVVIIDHITSATIANPYSASFESDLEGWTFEERTVDGRDTLELTSWVRGSNIPDFDRLSVVPEEARTIDGSFAIYTDGYESGEISYVYSPSFDLTDFNSPTISFLQTEQFDTDRDGVVMQQSTDDGRTWVTVGNYNADFDEFASTPGWYDNDGITASPGVTAVPSDFATATNVEGVGWAKKKQWDLAISPISVDPLEADFVRFRFALAAQSTPKNTFGFGFDLVQIYERNQVVLVEQFSSISVQSSQEANNRIAGVSDFISDDVLTINYFTDFGNGAIEDPINARNVGDPAARASYYGVDAVPSISIGGNAQEISDEISNELATDQSALVAQLNSEKLQEPPFVVTLDVQTPTSDQLLINADFTVSGDDQFIASDELALFVAIVEPEITLTEDIGIYNQGDILRNVLRKLLPNSAGQYQSGQKGDGTLLQNGDVLSVDDLSWTITNVFDASNLRVIAYVQDINTKRIYQATSLDVSGQQLTLSITDELEKVSLYPNPADKSFAIKFDNSLSGDLQWMLYDQSGRMVNSAVVRKGLNSFEVETSELPSGMYYINLISEETEMVSKRVIIVH